MPKAQPSYLGHRQRLREKFLAHGLDALAEYERIELLLTYAIARRDTKGLAKLLLEKFGSLENLLDASPRDLLAIPGIGESSAALILLLKPLCTKYLEERFTRAPIRMDSPDKMVDFLRMKIGALNRETMFILYLDARNQLIGYQAFPGTVDRAPIFVRDVVEEALLRHACSVVAAHNHPSGVCEPSSEDIRLIHDLARALETVGIRLRDHLVITKSSSFSFAAHKFLKN